MDLFEVLIVLVFIGLPLIEGILKQRRKGREAPEEQAPARVEERQTAGAGASSRGSLPGRPLEDDGPAAEMIPADLWEVLTGERRPGGDVPAEPAEEPWVVSEDPSSYRDLGMDSRPGWEPAPWATEIPTPESVVVEAPEAVSLEEDLPPRVVSLEELPPPPEERHRLFHARYDRIGVEEPTVEPGLPYDLLDELRGSGLRRAVLLTEILGPPKGLA